MIGASGAILFGPGQTLAVSGGSFTHTADGTLGTGALSFNGTTAQFDPGFDVRNNFV